MSVEMKIWPLNIDKAMDQNPFHSSVRINVSFFFPKSLYTMKHDIGFSRFEIGIFCVQLKIFLEVEIYFS